MLTSCCCARLRSTPDLLLQFLRGLDAGDILTESEKNAVVARKIGLTMPEAYVIPTK